MFKNILVLVLLFWSNLTVSNNYTSQDLLVFIYDNVTVDAPEGWQHIIAKYSVTTEDGRTQKQSLYQAVVADNKLIEFQTNNVFGPANAAHELMKLNGKDGNTPEVVTVFIRSDGAVAYEFE
ncbi:TPA: hypothetical protein ACVO3M_004403 [Vibrio diabolicus]